MGLWWDILVGLSGILMEDMTFAKHWDWHRIISDRSTSRNMSKATNHTNRVALRVATGIFGWFSGVRPPQGRARNNFKLSLSLGET